MRERSTRAEWFVGAGLAGLTLIAFAGVGELGFVRFDDPAYVTENPQVQAGLSIASLKWAFTTGTMSNWHPITWLSHMLDSELYGLEPAGHHATSVALHTINVLLLFALLRTLTGSLWRAALVAVLFAVHPLRVESVAWVSERKDVLSTFFGLLSALAYVAYARKGEGKYYISSAVLLALGLMAKPMVVTLPLVFLLMDYWPLDRLRLAGTPRSGGRRKKRGRGQPQEEGPQRKSFWQLSWEKMPLLVLSLGCSAVTFLVQDAGHSVVGEGLLLRQRLANAVVSYVRYIEMTIWPSKLGLLYPHPYMGGGASLPWWQIAGSALILLVVTAVALRARGQRYLVVGWLWYLVMLLPTIGLVQVGRQALADRYTYVPLVGLFIIAVWGGAYLLDHLPRAARAVALTGVGVVVALLIWRSQLQVEHWRDARTVVEHAIAVSPSSMMYYNLGNIFASEKDYEAAARQYQAALEIQPRYLEASANLGSAFFELGRYGEAIPHYQAAIRLDRDLLLAHRGLAVAFQATGDARSARIHWSIAERLQQGAKP